MSTPVIVGTLLDPHLTAPALSAANVALTAADAATFLCLSPKTLTNWRSLGSGPAYLNYSGKRVA